jgi:hypothetical protein
MRTLEYQRNKSQLDYTPSENIVSHDWPQLHECIRGEIEKNTNFNPDYSVVAYKGGTLEFKALRQLGIRSVNLETLSCPRYEAILQKYGEEVKEVARQNDCGCHKFQPDPKFTFFNGDTYHCSASEVAVFKYWIEQLRHRD